MFYFKLYVYVWQGWYRWVQVPIEARRECQRAEAGLTCCWRLPCVDPAQKQNTLTVKHLSSPTNCPLFRWIFFNDVLVHLFTILVIWHWTCDPWMDGQLLCVTYCIRALWSKCQGVLALQISRARHHPMSQSSFSGLGVSRGRLHCHPAQHLLSALFRNVALEPGLCTEHTASCRAWLIHGSVSGHQTLLSQPLSELLSANKPILIYCSPKMANLAQWSPGLSFRIS